MKKSYVKPCTSEVKIEAGTCFMVNSVGANSHEGFTPSTDPSLVVDDGTDDDSPFSLDNYIKTVNKQ